jgi:Ca2+-binding EF-hand superfamily protein
MSLIDKLSKEQIADFREAFSLFDHDENGSISASELGQVLKALGQNPSKNELSDMINEVDVDGNGTVEFAEFVILMTNKVKEMTKEEEISEAFNVLDKEKDNHISVKELKYFMRKVAHIKLSSEEAEAMIEFADSDEDGLVSFDDFLHVVTLAQGGDDANKEGANEADSVDEDSME